MGKCRLKLADITRKTEENSPLPPPKKKVQVSMKAFWVKFAEFKTILIEISDKISIKYRFDDIGYLKIFE